MGAVLLLQPFLLRRLELVPWLLLLLGLVHGFRRFHYGPLFLVEGCYKIWLLLRKCCFWLVSVVFLFHHERPFGGLVCDLWVELELLGVWIKIRMVVEWNGRGKSRGRLVVANVYLILNIELALGLIDICILLGVKRYVFGLVCEEILWNFLILHFRWRGIRDHSS